MVAATFPTVSSTVIRIKNSHYANDTSKKSLYMNLSNQDRSYQLAREANSTHFFPSLATHKLNEPTQPLWFEYPSAYSKKNNTTATAKCFISCNNLDYIQNPNSLFYHKQNIHISMIAKTIYKS